MTESTVHEWNWIQAGGTELKVISNIDKGTIHVYDSKGNCVLKKTNLTPDQVKLIEQQFLRIVTSNKTRDNTNKTSSFDPMVA